MISFFFNSKNENKRLDLRDHLTSRVIHFQCMALFGTIVTFNRKELLQLNCVVCVFVFVLSRFCYICRFCFSLNQIVVLLVT